jgi:hypothetical protein
VPQAPRVTLFYGLTAPRGIDVGTGRPHRFSSGPGAGTSRHDHFFQELVLHPEFPKLTLGVLELDALCGCQGRLGVNRSVHHQDMILVV